MLLDLPEGELLDGAEHQSLLSAYHVILVFISQGTNKMNTYPALSTSQTTLYCLSWV